MKALVSQDIFASIGLRKKSVLKFPEFSIWKMLLTFLQNVVSILSWEWSRHFTLIFKFASVVWLSHFISETIEKTSRKFVFCQKISKIRMSSKNFGPYMFDLIIHSLFRGKIFFRLYISRTQGRKIITKQSTFMNCLEQYS